MTILMKVLSELKLSRGENFAKPAPLKRENKYNVLKGRFWFPLHLSQRKMLLTVIDLILLNSSLLMGIYIYQRMPFYYTIGEVQPVWFITLTLLWLTITTANDNYKIKRADKLSTSVLGLIQTLLLTGLIYNFLPVVSAPLRTEPMLNLLVGSLIFSSVVIWRIMYIKFLLQPFFQRRFLIEGTGRAGRIIAQLIKEHDSSYDIIGYVNDKPSRQKKDLKEVYVSENWSNLSRFVEENRISDIVLTTPGNIPKPQLEAVLKCFEEGVRVIPMPILYEEITGRIPVEYINKNRLALLPIDWDSRRLYAIVKRIIDVLISAIGILVLAPSFILLAAAIKLDTPGPVFYRPVRLGRGGKPFRLWKFRTMVTNADRIGDPTFTAMNDQRITRSGNILRLTHMDELPQLFNVLLGNMSLVGPRPERFVPELEERIPYYRTRYAVKPGATGWALVKQGYAEGVEGTLIKLQYDLYYIKHQSLALDISILCKSVVHMLTMRGR